LIILAIFVSVAVCTQAQDNAVSTNAGAVGISGTNPEGNTTAQPATNPSGATTAGPSQKQRRNRGKGLPILLAGNVILASGEPPLERVMIKRVCPTQTITEGYTDASGHFAFVPGGNSAFAAMDASIGSTAQGLPLGTPSAAIVGRSYGGGETIGCALVADAPGYRSNSIVLGSRSSMNNSGVGTIILTPLDNRSQAALVSASSLAAPKKAKSAFEKAVTALDRDPTANSSKVISSLEKAVGIYPEYAEAWTAMGHAKGRIGDIQGAQEAFEKALAADPRYVAAYEPLILISVDQQNWERTSELASFVLSVDPSNLKIRWFNAVSQFKLGRHDLAISLLDEIQADEVGAKQYPQSHHIEGLVLAQRGQFTEAASNFERFLELAPDDPAAESLKRQLLEWKELGAI